MKNLVKLQLFTCATFLGACGGSGESDSGSNNAKAPANPPLQAPSVSLSKTQHSLDTQQAFSVLLDNKGGASSLCTAVPKLPKGLDLVSSKTSCLITGATLTSLPSTTFRITASNSAGESTLDFTLTVNDTQPLLVPHFDTQTPTSLQAKTNKPIHLSLASDGGSIGQCTITPELPSGLFLLNSPAACVIAGASEYSLQETPYTIVANNSAGQSSHELTIGITGGNTLAAPIMAQPSNNQFVMTTQNSFSLQLQNSGGPVSKCETSPALPEGLVVYQSSGSCGISGSSAKPLPETQYSVSGINSSGTNKVNVSLTINEPSLQPPTLSLSTTTNSLFIGDSFLQEITNQGGMATQCTSQPILPAGLITSIVAGNCVIHGTARLASKLSTYQISANNNAGSDSLNLSLEVREQPPQAPSFVVLNSNFFSWSQSSAVSLELNNNGGNISICSVTPTLPNGLSLVRQKGNCNILGSANQPQSSTSYLIVGRNDTGTTEQTVIIEVIENTAYAGEGPDPANYDHVVTLAENRDINAGIVSLHRDINNPEAILQLTSSGFPNRIKQIRSSTNELMTAPADIDQRFRLFIDPATGIVEIRVQKTFDYERDAAFYSIDLELGNEIVTLLLRLYDIQTGSANEPLKVATFDELQSFLQGQFVSDHIGFELISLPTTTQQNLANLTVELDRDIDASSTQLDNQNWPGYHLEGHLNGKQHVIKGLKMAQNTYFLSQPASNSPKTMILSNLGLTGVEANSPVIVGRGLSNVTRNFFVEGVMPLKDLFRVNTAPLQLTGLIDRVYTNMYIDVGVHRPGTRVAVSALTSPPSAPARVRSGYSNGRIVTDGSSQMIGDFSGLTVRGNVSVDSSTQFLSAVQLDITNPAFIHNGVGQLNIGGIGRGRNLNFGSNSTLRFIKDRNNSSIIRHVGNLDRDTDNDGIADAGATGQNWESAGILEADAKRSSNYTGAWLNSDFDLSDGFIPVLKNMPYPHIPGASWMSAADPGVAYQHHMYDYYLQDPRTR